VSAVMAWLDQLSMGTVAFGFAAVFLAAEALS
jgi:hypothetical protein